MNTVDIYGDMKVIADIINNEFEGTFVDDTFTLVRSNLFRDCVNLTKAKCVNATIIGARAFQNSGIQKVEASDFPMANRVDGYAFADCTDLVEVTLPAVVSNYQNYLFNNCTSLKRVYFPELTSIRYNDPYWFSGCTSLEAFYFPKVTSISGTTTGGCLFNLTGLEEILPEMLPVLTTVGSYTFNRLDSLKRIILFQLTSIGYRVYSENMAPSLRVIRFPRCTNAFDTNVYGATGKWPQAALRLIDASDTNIAADALVATRFSAPNIKTMILRSTTMVTLESATGRFVTATPLNSGGSGVDIYVPQNLISSYEADTNWSVLGSNGYGTARFHALEGSIYEDIDYDYDIGMED